MGPFTITRRIADLTILDTEAEMILIYISIHFCRLNCLTNCIILSISSDSDASMAPTALGRLAIIFTPIVSDIYQRCSILAVLFREQPSQYALSGHSAWALSQSYRPAWNQPPFFTRPPQLHPLSSYSRPLLARYRSKPTKQRSVYTSNEHPLTQLQNPPPNRYVPKVYAIWLSKKSKGNSQNMWNIRVIWPPTTWYRIICDAMTLFYSTAYAEE